MTRHTDRVNRRRERGELTGTRRLVGFALAVVAPPLTALVLDLLPEQVNLISDMLLFLLVTVLVARAGGLMPALIAAASSSLLINYFFTPPLHTLAIRDANNALAIGVFVAVAVAVSSAVDLADRRTRQAALAAEEARTLAPLAEANKVRTALLAAVGHDLRTPLAAAKAAVSSLRSQDVDLVAEDRDELLASADQSLDRLAGLVDNLLDMSRLNAGALAVELRPVPVDELIARALDEVGPAAVRVGVDLPADPPTVLCDAGLVERVLVNLLDNAVRYSPSQPPALVVLAGEQTVEIRVIDHGPGIPVAERNRVFLPFQRLGDTDNTTGIGLGLALARGLTEAMGGTLEPEETPGGGLTLVVSLQVGVQGPAEPGLVERGSS